MVTFEKRVEEANNCQRESRFSRHGLRLQTSRYYQIAVMRQFSIFGQKGLFSVSFIMIEIIFEMVQM